MHALARTAIFVAMLLGVVSVAQAQSGSKEPTGLITGRVTISGQAVTGVVVALQPSEYIAQRTPLVKATTDEDGRFLLTGVAPGRYRLAPLAPAFVASNQARFGSLGKTITVADGEAIEGIDLALTRGGVITGRITDAGVRPLIGEPVTLTLLDEYGQKQPLYSFSPDLLKTDDRGVYRIYGLPSGRYTVSVGEDDGAGLVRSGHSHSYPRTFYPNVTDEAKTTLIEVTAGGEATDVDIMLGRPSRDLTATGRIIDAESGRPVADAPFSYFTLSTDGTGGNQIHNSFHTNYKGEFRIEGLTPGRYSAFAGADGERDSYGDPVTFEVTNEDVGGLELVLRRGSSINGMAVVEGTSDPTILALLPQLDLAAIGSTPELNASYVMQAKVRPDGSFRLAGLRPGLTNIFLPGFQVRNGFSLLRVERDGVEQRDGIVVTPGEQVTGVRLVLAYGTGVVRGQMKITGDRPPDGTQWQVAFHRVSDTASQTYLATVVDVRGRFVIEGLISGDYELTLHATVPGAPIQPHLPAVEQTVSVRNGAESQVTLVIDIRARSEEEDH